MKLIKNNQEAYMGWHDGHPIWDRGIDKPHATPFYVENISGDDETLEIVSRSLGSGTPPVFDIEISSDGINWTLLGSTASSPTRTLNPGERLYMRASTNRWYISNVGRVAILGMTKVGGNIMSLLCGGNFTGDETTFPTNNFEQFVELFSDYTSTNVKLISADNLILPATALAWGCYSQMFSGCRSLTSAPALPATTLAQNCYSAMFDNCTSLITAPALPATTLADNCYRIMFQNCTSLTTAPELPATTLAQSCYFHMFYNCTSLPIAPALPATTLAQSCYEYMFYGCTSLTAAPALPANTLTEDCYCGMFDYCANLNYIKCLATDISASDCTTVWVSGVAATGIFTKKAGVSWPSGKSGIPSGWTVVEE